MKRLRLETPPAPQADPTLPLINIDHHLGNQHYGELNWVDPEAPARVQRVRATINHIGRDGEGWRTFTNGRLHRRWTLERLDEGPWRITDAWGI